MASTYTVQVAEGAAVEVREAGTGEPLVLIQTALAPDELVPLSREAAVADTYQVIDVRRRGYCASSRADGPGSVLRDAADCLAVLDALGARPAHVVGASYSGAVALEVAAAAPGAVRTLTLIEPPPRHGPPAAEFVAVSEHLHRTFTREGVTAALEDFSRALGTPSWLDERATADPDLVASIERDAATFFGADIPALIGWQFDPARAATISCPVLYVGGAASHPWFAQVRAWVRELFPDCEDHLITGAGHSVALTHSDQVAGLLAAFLGRHR